MKKLSLLFFMFLSFVSIVNASTGTVICTGGDTSPLNVRNSIDGAAIGGLKCNTTVEILNENAGSNSSCSKWYQIKQGDLVGYSCGEYIAINKESTALKGKVSCVENDDPLTVRDSVNGTITDRLSCDTEMTILDKNLGSGGSCSNWYKVSYGNNKTGYVCGTYVITEVDIDYDSDEVKAYRNSLKAAGFPESYLDALVNIHFEYPTWQFVLFDTGLDWNTVIENEAVKGRNLIYKTYGEGYRSLDDYSYNFATDQFYRHPTEVDWWYASRSAIEYFMDPRNYLNSKNIFTFESLSYEASFQTVDVINKILGNSFMPTVYSKYSSDAYTKAFIEAASKYDVSPVHLASRILQEQGINGSVSSLGGQFTYNNNTYSGYFNFYNIKATGVNPAIEGLVWAMGGVDHTMTSYGRPWNSPYKSILGGASFLSEDYISIGQNTLYFQKFDVSRDDGHYVHQYMQNITAPLTEGISTYNSYTEINGLLDAPLVFIIPKYENMPASAVKAPIDGNPNSYLKELKIDGQALSDFRYDKFDYQIEVEPGVSDVEIGANAINGKAKVTGTGKVFLEQKETEIKVLVTAENGNKSTYTIIITKKENEEDVILSDINDLKSLTIDKIDFVFNKDIIEYNLEVGFDVDKINLIYELEDSNSTVDASREVHLIVGHNTINITVTAENGDKKVYTLNIVRKDASIEEILNNSGVKHNNSFVYGINVNTSTVSLVENIKNISASIITSIKDHNNQNKVGTFATGDKITIKSGSEEKNFEVLIYGDVNGDGVIDKLDYLAILRHYYGYIKYTGVYSRAADVNRDGTIDKLDYLAVLRDYYGYEKIKQ